MADELDPNLVSKAAATGDRRKALVAIRTKLAADLDAASPNVSAMIAGRLSATIAEIESLATPEKESEFERVRRERTARLSGSVNATSATKPRSKQRA